MMNKIVPHDIDYKTVKRLNVIARALLYAWAIIAFTVLIIDRTNLVLSKEIYNRNLNSVIAIFSILYFLIDIIHNYLFQQAEFRRKNDFIDNSLKIKLAGENSEGYFSNDNFPAGIEKLGINGFENSFFSKSISQKMIISKIIKSTLILILFLLIIFFTSQSILITFIQIALPFTIIQQTMRLILFHYQLKKVVDTYKCIFSSTGKNKRSSLIIDNVINYEKTLSWGGIQLNSKLFNKYNEELSVRWESMKVKYNLVDH